MLGFFFIAPLLFGSGVPGPVPLRAQVRVSAGVVRLSDLVAAGAVSPAEEAATVVIVAAPQPGSPLHLDRVQLAARLSAVGLNPGDFSIPARIEVERAAWPIPLAAVQAALARRFHRQFLPAEIEFSPPLTVAAGDPGLVIEAVSADRLRQRLELRCRASKDPALLPFGVALALPRAEFLALGAELQAPRPAVRHAPASGPVLVRPGHVAQLAVNQKGFQLVTEVMPLESGRAGENVHALSLATHATLEVQVIGPNQVQPVSVVAEAPHAQHPL